MCWPAATRAMCRTTTNTPKRCRRVSDRKAEQVPGASGRRTCAQRVPPRPWLAVGAVSTHSATRHHVCVQSTLCGRPVAADRPLIMAIVNRTPDSFYDKGATFGDDAAREATHRAIEEGADVIDVGGVKAGPGESVDADAEIARLVPFIEWLRGAYPDQLISGGTLPRTRPFRVSYGTTPRGVVDDVIRQVTAAAERAVACGVARDRVLIDPAHDFGKNTFHGLLLLRHVGDLVKTGWPVLLALSNKDFVGETLGVQLTERLEGTLAATALAAAAGVRMFRAHEVAATRRVLEMVSSIQGIRPPTRTVRGLA